eukprot:scaffold4420_cov187-Amphora_coffeaeformis.AAC.6
MAVLGGRWTCQLMLPERTLAKQKAQEAFSWKEMTLVAYVVSWGWASCGKSKDTSPRSLPPHKRRQLLRACR